MSLEVYVWDVEHGNSMTLKTPDGKIVMIDCGMNDRTDFSPSTFVRNVWGVRQLDYLIVSHPHFDHIRDISNVRELEPRVLKRRHVDLDRLATGDYEEYDDTIREYI